MKMVKACWMISVLVLGLLFGAQSIGSVMNTPAQEHGFDQPFNDAVRHFALQDGLYGIGENYGYTESPNYEPMEVHSSNIQDYQYMADSPYYTVFFKGQAMRMEIGHAWIELELVENDSEEVQAGESSFSETELSVSGVFDSVDMEYEVDTSLLTESLVLSEFKECERFIYEISWGGMTPEYTETGSLLFSLDGTPVLEILPPFMKDDVGSISTDIHYELIETETGYELHKVIDAAGQEWLESAQYPVVIDPSMQTFEDAWQSSGLTPYGQYFKNLKEFVNPANGFLTITQTDLVIPGRGLDITISRVYQTPAIFYGTSPYDYEAPPVDLGKGWALDFPYVGTKYLHLWGGTVYKITWLSNTFENHVGSHFTLVKNGDNTYTLTMATGTVYEFDTSGKLTQIKDIDQNSISFTYESGYLTTITDTIGRTISLSYSSGRLWKITYNGAELEYSYDDNGCLQWMDDFLNRRTSYYYDSGYNYWLLSKIAYATTGYTTYAYDRFSDSDYYKYYVTDQRVYETSQVRHTAFSYTGTFEAITSSAATIKNESDVTKGSYHFTIDSDGLVTEQIIKNASATPIRKSTYAYNSQKAVTQSNVYNDGSTLSYYTYYAYDNWGNITYAKDAEGHEAFFSYANTSGSGFFMDNTGTIEQTFTNKFSNSTVPSSVHTALIGSAEKQDNTYVREVYVTYDSEAHPTESKSLFGNYTTYQTFSGTFNENTSSTSFSVDLTGHTVAGNAVLQITGLASDPTYSEVHSYTPSYGTGCYDASWTLCGWQSNNYKTYYTYTCGVFPDVTIYQGWAYIGPFTHYPGTLGYQSCATNPSCNQQSHSFTVTAYWKAYPAQVQYDVNGSNWKLVSSSLKNTTTQVAVTGLTNGENTLYFTESSAQNTKFSWTLYVPVDNSPDTYTTSMQYDIYGNITSLTDAESSSLSFTYSSAYSYAYLTEISAIVGQDTITTKATYDSYRGWITSIQEPKGVDAGSGYDYLYTHDLLGRVTKKEFPLLSGQSQRSYLEAVYDDTNRMATIIDQNRHYVTQQYDRLGRITFVKWHTGTYNTGTLYATQTYTYRYDDLLSTATDPGNHTFTHTYDFLGRITQLSYPDSSSVSCLYDDTNNKLTKTSVRGYDKIQWFDWLGRLIKVEEEYSTDSFAVTTYQYNESSQLISHTDAENHTTTFTYDSPFGLTRITYSDSKYEEYDYSDTGNITSFTDCNGSEITFTYDDGYRLTQLQYADLSTVSFTYDLNSNRIRMEDDAPNTGDYAEYSYDYWNRLVSQTRHIAQDDYTISYQYDVASRLTALEYPDSMQILYFYDDMNRTTGIKRYIDGQDDEILMENVQYNTENLLTQFDYGNDLQTTFSYDSRDRISTADVKNGATSLLDLDYSYDSAGDVTQLINGWRDTTSGWHTDTESYDYDGLDRLTSATCTSWSHTYSYDKAGNRTAKDSLTYTISAVNEVTALSDGTSFTYDDNGNRTQKTKGTETWVYTYDYANRLIKVEKDSTVLGEYHYDGDGRRIQVTENDVTTTYIHGGSPVLFEENSVGTASYIYGPRGLLAKRTTVQSESQVYYYHSDHLGSTRLVTDESGNIVTAATYHPFGESFVEDGSEEPYLFCGKEKDASDLYYFGARYYDSSLGRFITRDSVKGRISDPQSLNRYSYCFNNPLRFKDEFGLKPTFSDEEAQEAYEDQTGQSESDDELDSGDGAELVTSDPNSITLVLPDGTHITLDEYVQEGNVIVGYGYITYTNGAIVEMEQSQALCVIALDDSGEVEDYVSFTEDDINDQMSPGELKEVARKMEECVGKENISDLVAALNNLRDKAYDLGNESLGERAGKGMFWGGAASAATAGLGLLPAVGAGVLFGLLSSFGDDHKWNQRENFLGDLLFHW